MSVQQVVYLLLVRVTVAMMKYYDQKQLEEEGMYFAHSSI